MPTTSSASAVTPPLDLLRVGLAADGFLRWAAVDLTQTAEEARRRHDLSPVAAVALGQSLSAAALLLRFAMKTPSRLVLEALGDGPLGKLLAEADSEGRLRGRVDNPRVETPSTGVSDVSAAMGEGILRVTRVHGQGQHTSHVKLEAGNLSLDLAHYLEQSEQIHSAVLLGVLPRPDGIGAAGGLIVEALPGAEEFHLRRLEANIAQLGSVAGVLGDQGVEQLTREVLEGFEIEVLSEHPQHYSCRCNREQLLEQLIGLAAEDFGSLFAAEPTCLAVCAFCNTEYVFERQELEAARDSVGPAEV